MTVSLRTKRLLLGLVVVPLVTAAGLEIGARLLDRFRGRVWNSEEGRAAIDDVCRKLTQSWVAPKGTDPHANVDVESDPVIVQPYTGWEHPRTQEMIAAATSYYNTKQAERTYDIVILGGSVAQMFGDLGWKPLVETLMLDPRFHDRPIHIHNYALAGYKEPQQVMMLAYLFAMGHKPDAVINIDGFNEAALSWNNAKLGTNPLYPHVPHWAETGNTLRSDSSMIEYLYAVRSTQMRARNFGVWFLDSGLWRSCFLYHAGSIALDRMRRKYVAAYGALMDRIMNGPKGPGLKGPEFKSNDMALGHTVVLAWMETSTSILGMCKQRGIPYLHVLQPTLHDKGSKVLTPKEIENSTMDPTWLAGVEKLYPIFREMGKRLAERGENFFDASQVFKDHPEDVYYDVCHFAEHGNAILGEAIGKELARIDTR
ncbi:MAG TPA: hypothetical protein VGR31_12400 [Planctomycetota bacterium]|jgi:hypothetical protein|nr:hypothetical protein [Planctomycetota bacterium]